MPRRGEAAPDGHPLDDATGSVLDRVPRAPTSPKNRQVVRAGGRILMFSVRTTKKADTIAPSHLHEPGHISFDGGPLPPTGERDRLGGGTGATGKGGGPSLPPTERGGHEAEIHRAARRRLPRVRGCHSGACALVSLLRSRPSADGYGEASFVVGERRRGPGSALAQ